MLKAKSDNGVRVQSSLEHIIITVISKVIES